MRMSVNYATTFFFVSFVAHGSLLHEGFLRWCQFWFHSAFPVFYLNHSSSECGLTGSLQHRSLFHRYPLWKQCMRRLHRRNALGPWPYFFPCRSEFTTMNHILAFHLITLLRLRPCTSRPHTDDTGHPRRHNPSFPRFEGCVAWNGDKQEKQGKKNFMLIC